MPLPSFYNTGTATVAANATAVTGQGTNWLASIQPGDLFGTHKGSGVRVASVNSNTSITLAYAWSGPAQTAAAYEIQITPDSARVQETVRQLLETLTNGTLAALALAGSAAQKIAYYTGAGVAALTDLTAHGRSILGLSGGSGKFLASTGANSAVMQDILGTVAQASGVPTGSIVERGSNANGEYVRFADGTQICVTASFDVPYVGATSLQATAKTWPAAFAGNTYGMMDTITALTGSSDGLRAGVFSPSSINSGNFTPRYLSSANIPFASGDVRTIRVTGIGRWF